MKRELSRSVAPARAGCAFLAAVLWLVAGPSSAEEHAHWTYEGEHGPAHWGEEKGFETCKLGQRQTPVDIIAARKAQLPPIAFAYKPSPATVVDNGHTIQVKLPPGNHITVDDKVFELVQFHFHRPSEEKVKGKAFAMDAHLVHQAADGKLVVVGVPLQPGVASTLIGEVWKTSPRGHGESAPGAIAVDPSKLLPTDRAYYTFTGSLTTPPCSEGVTWFVLKTPVEVSKEQVATFAKRYPHNARPVQPLGDRVISESE
jgi:carbonic anhydrase